MTSQNPKAEFICPLTYEIMKDPVLTVTGHTYEREAIERWFATSSPARDPSTNEEISKNLVPNVALRKMIEEAHPGVTSPAPHIISRNEEPVIQRREVGWGGGERRRITNNYRERRERRGRRGRRDRRRERNTEGTFIWKRKEVKRSHSTPCDSCSHIPRQGEYYFVPINYWENRTAGLPSKLCGRCIRTVNPSIISP